MPKRVVIVVEGGVVQGIACDDPETEITLVDWDNLKEESPEKTEVSEGSYPADLGHVDRYLKEARERACLMKQLKADRA